MTTEESFSWIEKRKVEHIQTPRQLQEALEQINIYIEHGTGARLFWHVSVTLEKLGKLVKDWELEG